MRPLLPSLLLAAALALPCRAGPDSTAEYDALPYRDTFGDFEPARDDTSLILVLTSGEHGWSVLKAMPAEDRVRLLRTGLRLPPGPAAAWCASWCDADTLDLAEHEVATDLIALEFVARPDEWRGGLWNLIEHFSGDDVRSIVERLAVVHPRLLDEGSFSVLHKVMRPDALPVLADLLGPLEGAAPLGLEEVVCLHAWHTDRHRDAVARVLLGDTRSAGLSAEGRSSDGRGVPPLLRASLDEILAHPDGYQTRYTTWVLRWLRDVTPVESDVPWLVDLAWRDIHVATWSLRLLDDEGSLLALHDLADLADDAPGEGAVVARAALAARGDAQALAALRGNAADGEVSASELALAFLLELDPQATVDDLLARLLACDGELDGEDEPLFWTVCGDVDEALWEHRLVYGLSWGPETFAGLEERLLASDAGADLLHAAGDLPGCGTRRMAEEVLARCEGEPLLVIPSALLEHGAPEAYREHLRAWARSDDEEVREQALWTLLRIGDPASGDLLVEALRTYSFADSSPAWLARSPCPAVRAHLREIASTGPLTADGEATDAWDALVGLAVLDGLPEGVELQPWREDREAGVSVDLPGDVLEAVRALVLDGRPIDAFVRTLEASPDDLRWQAGDVRDPRVTAYLRGLQSKRHLELYPWATAELAIQGDPEARAETWQALRRGNYRWCDELDPRQSTMGLDFGTLPLWADFFESSCCQFPTARIVFDNLFDVEPAYDKGHGFTGRTWAHRWLAEHDGPFVWSRIEERFVQVPR